MPKYLLPRHVRVCIDDEGSVFLDIKSDRYVGLDRRQTRALAWVVQDWPSAHDLTETECVGAEEIAERLHGSGLLTTADAAGHGAAPLELPRVTSDLWQWMRTSRTRIALTTVLRFIRAYIRAVVLLRTRSFESVVQRVAARKANRGSNDQLDLAGLTQMTAAFLTLRPLLYTSRDKCLLDSLVLVEFLAAFDLFPIWVIAVRVAPFAAHSWVQADTYVLNGPVRYVRPYTPILAI